MAAGCDFESTTFHLRVFNGSNDSLGDCVVRFSAKIQPIGTLEPESGRILRDLVMPLPATVTVNWMEESGQSRSQALQIPPFPARVREVPFINLVRDSAGQFSVGWTNWR